MAFAADSGVFAEESFCLLRHSGSHGFRARPAFGMFATFFSSASAFTEAADGIPSSFASVAWIAAHQQLLITTMQPDCSAAIRRLIRIPNRHGNLATCRSVESWLRWKTHVESWQRTEPIRGPTSVEDTVPAIQAFLLKTFRSDPTIQTGILIACHPWCNPESSKRESRPENVVRAPIASFRYVKKTPCLTTPQ